MGGNSANGNLSIFVSNCSISTKVETKMKKQLNRVFCIFAVMLSLLSCREEIDKSNRFTFTGETVADYMLNRSEKYSHMITLMERAGLFGLLRTYGQYTLFLPDNAAVERYLREQDSIYWATKDSPIFVNTGITSPDIEELSDSMAVIIARSHLLNLAYHTADMGEGALPTRNFNNRYLGINYDVVGEKFYIMVNNKSAIIDGDNEVENGIIHIVDKAINPVEMNVPQLIASCNFFSIFNEALNVTGFKDSLALDLDMSYIWDPTATAGVGTPSYYPKLKYHKYTGFIETDDVFNTNGIYALADLKVFAEKWYGTEDRDNFESSRNALNKFVAYHIIEGEYPSNKILPQGEKYDIALGKKYPRVDYFETMQGTLMKVVKPYGTQDAANIYINYSKREIPYNPELHHHLNVRLIETTEFTQADLRHSDFVQNALNGVVQPIDKILIYNEDEMVGNILNERMRFDFLSMMPELSSNNIRYKYSNNNFTIIPADYCRNIKSNSNQFKIYKFNNEGLYFLDDLRPLGLFDFSFRFPPVPSRTYEIRFSCVMHNFYDDREAVVQIYIDNKVSGLPIDFRIGCLDQRIGWFADEETNDNGVEKDKQMRNRGWMKAPDSFNLMTGEYTDRSIRGSLRRIVDRKYLSEGEHWIRFKNVSENTNFNSFMFDYIELVPLHIVSDPNKPEDRH